MCNLRTVYLNMPLAWFTLRISVMEAYPLFFLLIKPNPFLESLEDINLSWKKGIDFSVWNGHLKYRLECYRIRLNKGFMSSHQDAQRRNLFNIVVALNFGMDKPNTVGRRSTYLLSVFDIPSIKNLQA